MSPYPAQLQLLRELSEHFAQAQLAFWLRSGWALDFWLGAISREHSDIDLVAWKADAPRIRTMLTQVHFILQRDSGIQMDFAKDNQDVSIVFIASDAAGQVYTPDIPQWRWRQGCLEQPLQQLEGLACQVLSLEQLQAEKEEYEAGTGRPLRPKDRHSLFVIRQLRAAQ